MQQQQEAVVLAQRLGEALQLRGWTMATAESCTGGLIAATLTEVPGSSAWFDSAVVSYSNQAKQTWLNVSTQTLVEHGAVSEATVAQMAQGVQQRAGVALALAVSGIAGPTGGSACKPVGTVCFAWAWPNGQLLAKTHRFTGTRAQVRAQTVQYALQVALEYLDAF